jgi:hypothetical protein
MRTRKTLLATAMLVMGLGTHSLAADVEFESRDGLPLRFYHAQPLIIVHQGLTSILSGYGNTPLDELRTINCKSASGCLVTTKLLVDYTPENCPAASTFLDGAEMNPGPAFTCNGQSITQQSAIVSKGDHTIQSAIMCLNHQGCGRVTSYEAEYARYDAHQEQ